MSDITEDETFKEFVENSKTEEVLIIKEKMILSDMEDVVKQPLSPKEYNNPLTVLEKKISEAEGVGEVVYFEEFPKVPHLTKYFEIYVDENQTEVDTDTDIQSDNISSID